jgi:hypothetical protein
MIIMSWDVAHPAKDRVFDETLDKVIWETNVPVLAGRLNQPTKALERTVLVIASRTLGVKLDDRMLELAQEIGDAFETPSVVLATSHYLEKLTRTVSSWNDDDRHHVVVLDEDNLVEDIVRRLNEDDLLILTTMGSRQRFSGNADRIPKMLLDQIACPLLVLHRP